MSSATLRQVFAVGLAAVGLCLVARPAPAQQATISGRVTDQTGRPVADARITLARTDPGAVPTGGRTEVTDAEGRYTFAAVAPGRLQLRVTRVGYQSQVQILTVASGESATANFEIEPAVIALDEVVVTATGQQRQRELGNAITKLETPQVLQEAPITSVSDLLTGRAAGVTVQQSSGTTGSGTRIRIRGANSISLSNEPIVYVDGIRVETGVASNSIGVGGQEPSRFNDINPEDIESMEIIKGPSAATLYGTEAANGVIRITTKRGRPGSSRWNVYAEQGAITDPNEYPTNYRALGHRPGRVEARDCPLASVTVGSCTQDSVKSYNVLEDPAATPVSTGSRSQLGANVSGGTDAVSYFISGEWEQEVGTYALPQSARDSILAIKDEIPRYQSRPNQLERVSVRANVRSQVLQNADLSISTGYTLSDLQLPQNDNNSLGILPSGFFGTWAPDVGGGWGFRTPAQVFAIDAHQSVERFTSSAQGSWQPFSFLTARATLGVDVTSRNDVEFFPTGEVPVGTLADGDMTSNQAQIYQYTADFGLSAAKQLTDAFGSRTSVGVQYFRDLFHRVDASGNQLPAGARSVGAAAVTQAGEVTAEDITLGIFVEQQFSVHDRLFLTAAVRADDNSAFGRDFEAIIYPKFGASWVVTEEPFFPQTGFLSSLRLRGAWGATGLQPGPTDAIAFFNPVSITDPAGVDKVGVEIGGVGNVALKPERATEFEGGADIDVWNGRVGLQLTYFHKKSTDALVERVLAPSLGSAADRFENLGSVLNRGWEGVLTARLLESDKAAWDVTLTGSTLHNELIELGEGIEPIILGTQRHTPGYPLGSWWDRRILGVNDANGDQIISLSEVTLSDTAEYLGPPLPTRELSIQSSFLLLDRLRLQGLLDYRGGHLRTAGTKWFRCSQIQRCESAYLPGSDFNDQAAAITARSQLTEAGYITDASFWRLREASLTFYAPDAWARAIRASRLSVTLTGRNLLTITDWPDLDPEAQFNQGSNFGNEEFLTQPQVRYWIARLNLTF